MGEGYGWFPDGPGGSKRWGFPFSEVQYHTHYLSTEVTSGKAQIHPSIERSTLRSCLPSRVIPHKPIGVLCNSFGSKLHENLSLLECITS